MRRTSSLHLFVLMATICCATPAAADLPGPSLVLPGSVAEGDAGTRPLQFTARWMALPGVVGPIQIQWQTVDAGAVANADYVAAEGVATVSMQQPVVPLTVTVIGDTDVEPAEDIQIVYAVVGTALTGQARLWINDDDGIPPPPPPPAVSIVHAVDASTREPASGTTTVSAALLRVGPLLQPLDVTYTLDPASTATAGVDWQGPTAGVVRFAPGAALARIEIAVAADSEVEPVETIRFALDAGATALLPRPSVAVTIHDRGADPVPPVVGVFACRRDVLEHDGPARFVVRRQGDASAALSVDYATVAGSATAGVDYTPAAGTLSWAAADATVRVVEVPLVVDAQREPPELFRLALSTAQANVGIAPASAVLVILDAHDHIHASDFAEDCAETR